MDVNEEQIADLRATHKEIDLGFQIEAFLLSDIGKFLISRAEEEIEEAVDGLKNVSPTDTSAIMKFQNEIRRAENIQFWLAEAIQAGANAQSEFLTRGT